MFSEDLDVLCEDCGNRGEMCAECTKVSESCKPQKDYWGNICEINRRQTEKGIRTYGQRLEDNIYPGIIDRINYYEEELVDALKYAEWIKDEFEKHRWHDLQKNPNDLPNEYEDVICLIKKGKRTRYIVSWQYKGLFILCNNYKVIAWKKFEPFEVE